MANVSEKNKQGSGLSQLSVPRKTGWAIIFALVSVFILLALIDYDPSNFHSFPPEGTPPLLGKTGNIIARYAFAYFGISAWFLPWFFGVCSWLLLSTFRKEQKLQKLVPLPFVLISVSLMANLKDYSAIIAKEKPLFDQLTFEHGAGGSLGADRKSVV